MPLAIYIPFPMLCYRMAAIKLACVDMSADGKCERHAPRVFFRPLLQNALGLKVKEVWEMGVPCSLS